MKRLTHVLLVCAVIATCSCQVLIDNLFYDKVERLLVMDNQGAECSQFSLDQFIDEVIQFRGWKSREEEWFSGTDDANRIIFIDVTWPRGIKASEGAIYARVTYSISRKSFMVLGVRPSNDPVVQWMAGVIREELERQGHSENCVKIDVSSTLRAR